MRVHHLYGLRINCWLQSRKSVSILTYLDNAAETNKVLGKAAVVWDHKETRFNLREGPAALLQPPPGAKMRLKINFIYIKVPAALLSAAPQPDGRGINL